MGKKADSKKGAKKNAGRPKAIKTDSVFTQNMMSPTARQMRAEDLERAYTLREAKSGTVINPAISKLHAQGWLPKQIAHKLNIDLSEVNIAIRKLGPVHRREFASALTQAVRR